MRFAFVVNNYPPRVGGVESHVHSLATRLVDGGHDVLVVTLSGVGGSAFENGIEVVRLREHFRVGDVLGFPSWGATRRVTRLLRRWKPDVVSVHTRFFPLTWIGLRAGRRAGAVVVHTEHGSGHVVSPSVLISGASRFVDYTLGRSVLRRADEVLGVSENVTAFVSQLSGREARVFYNAIDPSATTGRISSPDRLVFVGRLVPGKGADLFVDIVDELVRAGRDIEGVILGAGPESSRIAAQIAARGLEGRVRMAGRVSVSEVRETLRGAVLVNPTSLAEGFQTTLLEALDVGGRVATYDVPGSRVLKDQGHAVEIVGPADSQAMRQAVERCLDTPGTARPLTGWYWEDRAREYVDIADEALLRVAQQGRR